MSHPPPADDAATVSPPQIDLDHAETIVPDSSGADSHYAPGVTFPGYQLLKELGRGGMGVVYLANQHGLNRQVALKMVLAGGHATATEKARFLAEAEAVAAVRHPGVVQVFDFGTHDGHPFFALEFLAGGSLAAKLNGTPMPPRDAAALVAAIARAVQAAHDAGVIHRDLKPGNILFDADGSPKVTDFGLARRAESSSGLTQTGAILGTPSYMAPEQAQGRKDVGPPADGYAVGAVLYECLTGRPPFRAATPLETIHQVLKDEPVPPSRLVPKLPRDVETVCLKCLSKDPRKRYPSSGAIADDLARFLAGEPIVARPVSAAERGWRWLRRNPMAGTVVGLVFAALGTVVGVQMSANARLERERNVARAAEADANTQRALADARLEKAVEAVDRMLTRVAGERWASNPALQAERRQVLQDAAAFYTGFTGEDSADPRVRREAAKAHARVAGTLLMANDMPKAEAAGRSALALYDGLAAEFPDDPEFPAAASEVHTLLGNMAALTAQFESAIAAYRAAVGLAKKAVALRPDDPTHQLRVVQATVGECYFYLQSDFSRGRKLAGETLALARRLGEPADASYEAKLELAYALFLSAAFDLTANELAAAGRMYDEADRVLRGLAASRPPTARLGERYSSTKAVVAVQQGVVAYRTAGTPDEYRRALALMDAGLAALDTLLAVQPQAFPYLAQKLPTQAAVAVVCRRLGDDARADAALAALDRLEADLRERNPTLFWVGRLSGLARSMELVERANRGRFDGLADRIDRLVSPTPVPQDPVVVYNAACACSLASRTAADPAAAEVWAVRGVAILTRLHKAGYFRVEQRVQHALADPDLAPLQNRPDFQAFLEAVRKSPAGPLK